MSRFPVVACLVLITACGPREAAPEREVALATGDTAPVAVVSPEELTPAPEPAAETAPPAAARIATTSNAEITTRRNKVGDLFVATVSDAVTDGRGREVIPASATVTFPLLELKEAENQDDAGTLVVRPEQITIAGASSPLAAEVAKLAVERRGRGVTAGDAGKVAGAAAAGAVLGKIITKKGTGAAIGGAVGAAAGTAIAIKSADKDLVIPAGSRIVLKLVEPFPAR
jgi:hypothetical protein